MRVTWPRPSYCDILHSLWSELGWTNTITAHSSVIIRLEMELQIQMTFEMADYSENCQNSLFRMSDHLLSSYKLLSWTELTVSCWYQYLYQTTSSLCSYYRSAVSSLQSAIPTAAGFTWHIIVPNQRVNMQSAPCCSALQWRLLHRGGRYDNQE